MRWENAEKEHLKDVLQFLIPREYACASLTSRLHTGGIPVWPGRRVQILMCRDESRNVHGIVYIENTGMLFSALSPPCQDGRLIEQLFDKIKLPPRKIHTCMGQKKDVEPIESKLPGKPIFIDYFLMAEEGPRAARRHGEKGLAVRRADQSHARLLFPLQEGYEKEEVLIRPEHFNPERCFRLLKKSLTEHIVYFGCLRETAVAKAGTNALGFSWYQLGGVYTLPQYRSRGYGREVTLYLLDEISVKKKKATLFVKINNAPAIKLYRSLGFKIQTNFRISYFR